MLKQFNSKIKCYSLREKPDNDRYGILKRDFMRLIQKQLEEFDCTVKDSYGNVYIKEDEARKLLYSIHMKLCEINEITK